MKKIVINLTSLLLSLFLIRNDVSAQNPSLNLPTQLPNVLMVPYPSPPDYDPNTLSGKKNFIRTYTPVIATDDENIFSILSQNNQTTISTNYFDGLGRSLQSVQKKGVGNMDFVETHVYDNVGREAFKYLPLKAYSSNGKFKNMVFTDITTFYNSQYFTSMGYYSNETVRYSKTDFDNSPLNRVKKTVGPGINWAGAGLGITNNYETNDNINEDIKIWDISLNIPKTESSYVAGELFKNVVTDEDGGKIIEYRDKSNKVVLKKILSFQNLGNSTYLNTYYVYDELERLRFVIPPLAVEMLDGALNWVVSQNLLDELCFQYEYDERGRIIEKKIPGKGIEYIIYDIEDRPILTQDAKQRLSNKWSFIFYDQLGRVKMSGIYTRNVSRQAIQDYFNGVVGLVTDDMLTLLSTFYYANDFYPPISADYEVYNYIYYDKYIYAPVNLATFSTTYANMIPAGLPNAMPVINTNMTHGLITSTRTRVLKVPGSNLVDWIDVVNFYDSRQRLIQTQMINQMGGIDIVTTQYDFNGKKLAEVAHHENPTVTEPLHQSNNIVRTYTYDGMGRPLTLSHKINGAINMPLNSNVYDALGRLSVKYLGGSAETQTYTYNLRGWLTAINPTWVNDPNASHQFFGEVLCYDRGFAQPKYNGNIAGILWRGSGTDQRAYGYSYDLANRLQHAEFRERPKVGQSWGTFTNSPIDFTTSNITYDANGNILSMNQKAPGVAAPIDMDLLTYTYKTVGGITGNQLDKVNDATLAADNGTLYDFKDGPTGTATVTDYDYDVNGNMISDANKDINSITYNYLNKPELISLTANRSIRYTYDAIGTKLRKEVNNNGDIIITDYVNGHIYETKTIAAIPSTTLQYILHEEGRLRPLAIVGATAPFIYDFFIKDHLGNVRSTINVNISYGVPLAATTNYSATHETINSTTEGTIFGDIDDVRAIRPGTNNPANLAAIVLDGDDPTKRIGTSLMLRVMAGDKFTLKTQAYYNTSTMNDPISPEELIGNIINALNANNGAPVSSEFTNAQIIDKSFNNPEFLPAFTNMKNNATDNNKPKGYLNYLLFDNNLNFIPEASGTIQVNQDNTWHEIGSGMQEIEVANSGYMYVFHSCESASKVYFDDFLFTIYQGGLLEEDHYYPYGLAMKSLHTEAIPNNTPNRYKYNGKEIQRNEFGNDVGLEWNDYGARMQDPQIGRWHSVDPHASSYPSLSGYSAMGNNPISIIDPDGADIIYYNQKGAETNRTVQDGAHVYYMQHNDGNVKIGNQSYYQGNSYASFFWR
jgi:RHS repeat-associated protein